MSCVSLSELIQLGVSINGGTPIAGWFIVIIVANPIKMDDLGVPPF